MSDLQILSAHFSLSKQSYATQSSQGRFPRGQAALVQVSVTYTGT